MSKPAVPVTAAEQVVVQKRQSEELFRLLVSSVKDYAIFMLDPQGNVASWNAGAERIKGYRADEIIGHHFSQFYTEEEKYSGKCELELEVASKVGRFEDEGWRVRKDGTRFWANVVIGAVRNERGELVGFSKVTRDLTERKANEEERAARLAAEKANRAKDEFLAMLGHELRNPLAPIVTALQLLKLRGEMRSSKEHQIIERQVKHMMHLVDDLLDVSRITRGKIELVKTRVAIQDLLAKAIEIASPLLEQRRHHLNVDVGDALIYVDGEEARLVQVFANLITNAAKYTESGGHVSIAVSTNSGEVSVAVADDGVGIEPELLPRIFDLFVQGAQQTDRAAGGLGLGLTVVRSLIELHGGRVEAHSGGKGRGSTFTARLPVVATGSAQPGPLTQPAMIAATLGPVRRILVVDDNDDARVLLAELLSRQGHDVQTASDAAAALDVVKGFTPDVAILDIGLPVMDGYELAQRLRSQIAPIPRLIALTGYGQESDRERSRLAGFDLHLVKPVDLDEITAGVADLTARP
ncbi:MAG TPA: ATP-binding protein [Kofleriaceae bacterium]